MRTEELMREYQQGTMPMPDGGWQKLVYLAAEMMKMAKQMRNTLRAKRVKAPFSFVQDELFTEGSHD